jgi:hypothetical protein
MTEKQSGWQSSHALLLGVDGNIAAPGFGLRGEGKPVA